MTGTLPITTLRKRLSKALGQLRGNDQWIVVTRYGEAAAALVSLNLLRRALEAAAADQPEDLLEAKSAIRTPTVEVATSREEGQDDPEEKPDAQELLDRIARTRRSFGLPPLRR